MASEWKCLRCSTKNSEGAFSCSSCGLLRGSAVPAPFLSEPSTPDAPERATPAVEPHEAVEPHGAVEPRGTVDEPETATPEISRLGSNAQDGWIQPEPTASWRRIVPIVVGIGIALVVAGAGWYFGAGRSSSGDIERGGDLAASELRVGDCFDLKDPAAEETEDVTALPCAQEHEYETFFVGVLAEGPYPADPDETFTSYVEDSCVPAFEPYVGKTYADSELEIFWFYPTSDGWASGDRSIQCAVYHPRIHRLTESLKGSDR